MNKFLLPELLALALVLALVLAVGFATAFFRLRRRARACRHELARVAREKHALQMRLCADPGQAGDEIRARILDGCMAAMARLS